MSTKNSYNYFDTFVQMTDFSCQAAQILSDTLNNFDVTALQEKLEEMHKIEHAEDLVKHEMMRKLVREFITPIEREDIISLAQELDDVTDTIEDVLIRLYMFNTTTIRSEALEFCDIIIKCCASLKKAMEEFKHFKKSQTINSHLIEINQLEEVGDKIYTDATRRLFIESENAVEILRWRETFDRFEKCCDSCEDVTDVIESIIMKNS